MLTQLHSMLLSPQLLPHLLLTKPPQLLTSIHSQLIQTLQPQQLLTLLHNLLILPQQPKLLIPQLIPHLLLTKQPQLLTLLHNLLTQPLLKLLSTQPQQLKNTIQITTTTLQATRTADITSQPTNLNLNQT